MYIYVLEDKEVVNVVAIPNPTADRLGRAILETQDKYGSNATIILSQENVTDPLSELIINSKA